MHTRYSDCSSDDDLGHSENILSSALRTITNLTIWILNPIFFFRFTLFLSFSLLWSNVADWQKPNRATEDWGSIGEVV
jgi:hypothetical protein